jgi:hypothetical protein
MTLPDERYRAVIQTRKFLEELLTTPRLPSAVKNNARWCLRHYPTDWDMKVATRDCPDIFQERMEPLTRMLEVYKIEQKEENNDKAL